jgi:hypothetical protein
MILSGCSSMNIPPSLPIPLLKEKGEGQLEFSASTNSLYLSGTYAFSKKYAFLLDGSLSYRNFTEYYDIFTHKSHDYSMTSYLDVSDEYGAFAHRYGEIGFGMYNILQNKFKLEAFAGGGYGVATDQDKYGRQYDAYYYAGFAQINFGRTFKKFAFGWPLRFAFTSYDYSFTQTPHNIKFNMFHIQPGAFIRFAGKRLKVTARLGINVAMPFESFEELEGVKGIYYYGGVNTTLFHLSVGINYKFDLKRKHEE